MTSHHAPRGLIAAILTAALLTACGSETSPEPAPDGGSTAAGEPSLDETSPDGDHSTDTQDGAQRFPDVIAAELEQQGDTWRLDATLSSPYDTPERYADAFRVLSEDGTELGVRELLHDHANEQPFTRSLTGLLIPDHVASITVEGRDQVHGWGGDTVELEVPSGSDGHG
jgi:hypothetical protein